MRVFTIFLVERDRGSLRRISSDEVTYSLHAILRFELERDYFAGLLTAGDMAEAWNDKYESYLGIRPQNDTEGVLQDMHWAGDYIGYFQSYALGNIFRRFKACAGDTALFIYPGFDFMAVDAMVTNFHLPKSTLVMLVAGFTSRDHIIAAYNHAVKEGYRFFSFGDAMFIARHPFEK